MGHSVRHGDQLTVPDRAPVKVDDAGDAAHT
jgi:hypothetical protein